MPKLQVFECDICEKSEIENSYGDGVPGWGQLFGIKLDGMENPILCPDHLKDMADFMDGLKHGVD